MFPNPDFTAAVSSVKASMLLYAPCTVCSRHFNLKILVFADPGDGFACF